MPTPKVCELAAPLDQRLARRSSGSRIFLRASGTHSKWVQVRPALSFGPRPLSFLPGTRTRMHLLVRKARMLTPLLAVAVALAGFSPEHASCSTDSNSCCNKTEATLPSSPCCPVKKGTCCESTVSDLVCNHCAAARLSLGCCCVSQPDQAPPAVPDRSSSDTSLVSVAAIASPDYAWLAPTVIERSHGPAPGLDSPAQPSLNVLFCVWLK
jgi:hypothetical protein